LAHGHIVPRLREAAGYGFVTPAGAGMLDR